MNVLLDTQALLWWLSDDPRLGTRARAEIAERAGLVCVSAASAWEISVKAALGKLAVPTDDIGAVVEDEGFEPLPITFEHARVAGHLPAHHRDPFDRMLVAQAQVEHLTLLTTDRRLAAYDVEIAWATT